MKNPTRENIRDFLERPCNVYLMGYATSLKRPAVEPLQCALLAEFDPQQIREKPTRRMIGRLARQVMKSHGYKTFIPPKKIRINGILFTKASMYRKL